MEIVFDLAIDLEPGSRAEPLLAEALAEVRDLPEKALADFRRAARLDPTDPDFTYILGNAYVQAGRHAEAAAAYREAISLNRDDPTYYAALGMALWRLERHGEAEGAFREALQLAPEDPSAWNGLGVTLLGSRPPREAVSAFQRALAAAPEAPALHANLAVALWRDDRPQEALAEFEKAVRLQPGAAAYHRNLGRALAALDRHREALASLGEAARLAPQDASAHLDRGEVLFSLGRLDEAEAAFDEATRRDPHALAGRERSRQARQSILVRKVRNELGPQRASERATRRGFAGLLAVVHGLAGALVQTVAATAPLRSAVWLAPLFGILYGAWVVGPPYARHLLLRDDMASAARAPVDDDTHVLERLLHAVRERGLDGHVGPQSFQIHSRSRWRTITCAYVVPVDLLPGLRRTLSFAARVEEPYVVVDSRR